MKAKPEWLRRIERYRIAVAAEALRQAREGAKA
jgi:hypothetical protein